MSITKELISLQNSKEQVAFIGFLNKRNKRHDTRNIQLYKHFLSGTEKSLTSELSANAYNALKKRLRDLLIEFTARNTLTAELSDENKVIKYLVTARKLISHGAATEGMKLLYKAESMALKLDQYSLLNEIYHTIIEHAHMQSKMDLESLFSKLKRNNEQFIVQEKLSVLYARMYHEFIEGTFQVMPTDLRKALHQGLSEFEIKPEQILNFKSLNQLCILTDLYGSQTKRYDELDLFFEKHIATLQGTEKDTEKMLPYHVELLYGMANIYFRKKDLLKSQAYLENLNLQLERFNEKLKEKWQSRCTNLLALNMNFLGEFSQAIEAITARLLNGAITDPEKALLTLTLSMIQFQQGDISTVKQNFLQLQKSAHWYQKHMGTEWLFNYKAMEILMHFDLGNDLLVESRINSFKRKYAAVFLTEKDNPIWPFLKLIQSILFDNERITSKEFKDEVDKNIPWKGKNEDFFNICFYAWLKAKMTIQPLYKTTLDLLRS